MRKTDSKNPKRGFTLIELLVVISIIGFLATVAVYAFNVARQEAKYNKCRAELKQIVTAIELKRDEYNTALRYVTGSGCSRCSCTPYPDGFETQACINRMTTTFKNLGFPGFLADSWGDPYLIDENEYEYSDNPCRRDLLWSYNCGSINVPFYICDE